MKIWNYRTKNYEFKNIIANLKIWIFVSIWKNPLKQCNEIVLDVLLILSLFYYSWKGIFFKSFAKRLREAMLECIQINEYNFKCLSILHDVFCNNTVIRSWKTVWKYGTYCWYFPFNLKYLGWQYREYI